MPSFTECTIRVARVVPKTDLNYRRAQSRVGGDPLAALKIVPVVPRADVATSHSGSSRIRAYIDVIESQTPVAPTVADRHRPVVEALESMQVGSLESWLEGSDSLATLQGLSTYAFADSSKLSPFQSGIFFRNVAEAFPVRVSKSGRDGTRIVTSGPSQVYTASLSSLLNPASASLLVFPGQTAGSSVSPRKYSLARGHPLMVTGVYSSTAGDELVPVWNASRSMSIWNADYVSRGGLVTRYVTASTLMPAVLSAACNWEYLGAYRHPYRMSCTEAGRVSRFTTSSQKTTSVPTSLPDGGSGGELQAAGVYLPLSHVDNTVRDSTVSARAAGKGAHPACGALAFAFYNNTLTRETFDTWFMGLYSKQASEAFGHLIQDAGDVLSRQNDYRKALRVVERRQMIRARMIFIAKSKYPNFFNPASREFLFREDKHFDIDRLPLAAASAIQIELDSELSIPVSNASRTCEHYAMVAAWRRGLGTDLRLRDEIRALVVEIDQSIHQSAFLRCKICEGRVMCPHELELSMTPDEKKILLRNKYCRRLTTPAGSESASGWNCDICGEEMHDRWEVIGEDGISYTDRNSGSYNSSASADLEEDPSARAARTVFFIVRDRSKLGSPSAGITKKSIIAAVTDIVKYYVERGAPTGSTSGRGVDVDLVINVFAYACMVACSVFSKGEILVSVPGMVFDKDTRSQFMAAFASLKKYSGAAIAQLKEDDVKELLVRAYGAVREDVASMIFGITSMPDGEYLPSAEVYRSAVRAKKASRVVQRSTFPFLQHEAAKSLFGKYVDDAWKSFEAMAMFRDSSSAERGAQGVGQVPQSERLVSARWKQWQDSLSAIRSSERRIVSANILQSMYPYSSSPISSARYFRESTTRNLSPHVCIATRSRHVFDLYISEASKSSPSIEVRRKDLSPYVTDPSLKTTKWADRKCTACRKTLSELKGSKAPRQVELETALKAAIDAKSMAGAFYAMFEHRCLVEGFHDWSSKRTGETECTKCTKCNMPWSAWWGKTDWYLDHVTAYTTTVSKSKEGKARELSVLGKSKEDKAAPLSVSVASASDCGWANKSKVIVQTFVAEFALPASAIVNLGNTEGLEEGTVRAYGGDGIEACSALAMGRKVYEHVRFLKKHLSLWISLVEHDMQPGQSIATGNLLRKVLAGSAGEGFNKAWTESKDKQVGRVEELKSTLSTLQHAPCSPELVVSALIRIKKESPALAAWALKSILAVDQLYTKFDYGELRKSFQSMNYTPPPINSADADDLDGMDVDDIDLFDHSDLSMDNMADDDIDA